MYQFPFEALSLVAYSNKNSLVRCNNCLMGGNFLSLVTLAFFAQPKTIGEFAEKINQEVFLSVYCSVKLIRSLKKSLFQDF